MTVGICRLCYAAGAIEPSAAHAYRCPDHAACAARADLIGEPVPPPGTLPHDDEVRLKRRLAAEWVDRNLGAIGGVIVEHYRQGAR